MSYYLCSYSSERWPQIPGSRATPANLFVNHIAEKNRNWIVLLCFAMYKAVSSKKVPAFKYACRCHKTYIFFDSAEIRYFVRALFVSTSELDVFE